MSILAKDKRMIVKSFMRGVHISDIVEIWGVDKSSVYKWVKKAKRGESLERKKSPGSGRLSSIDRRNGNKILKMIKMPASKFGFETDLWTTTRILTVCKKRLKLNISRMCIWRFLTQFRKSFKKVQKQYYETDIEEQEKWKRTTRRKITRTVKKHRAILYFEDESNIALTPVMGKSWGGIGEKVIHKVTGNKGSVSAISAISKDGRLIFNVFDKGKRFNSDDIIRFLKRMLKYHEKRHLVVVMDRATCHTSKKTKTFIKTQKRLHVFYLPPRSPELNPDEQVWAHLKNHELKSHQETTTNGLKLLTKKKLQALSRNQSKVRGIFKRCDNSNIYL